MRTANGAAGLLMAACSADAVRTADPRLSPSDRAESEAGAAATASGGRPDSRADATRCSDVRLPERGIGEADYGIDRANGLLDIHFGDRRRGKYRNIEYTVRYRDDPTCRRTPEMAQLIEMVIPSTRWRDGRDQSSE